MRRLLLAVALLLGAVASADAADVFSTDASTPKKATVNGAAFFPRIFYDSGESSNFADQSVSNLNLGRFGMTHYLNYQFGAPYQKAVAQLTPLAPLGMWGFATGNAFGTSTVDNQSATNGTFAVVANTPAPTTPFRQLFPTLAGAGGVYLADEVSASLLSNVNQWRTTYHTDMPTIPALVVLLPEGPLTPSNAGVEDPTGSAGFMEHVASVANPYWWMRNLPAGGNDWIGEDPYPLYRGETVTGNTGCDPNCGVLEQGGYPHFFVADRAAHVVAAAKLNGKVPILILQLFTGNAGGRFPTPNEMWQHMTMGVAEGIRGLGWWQIGTNGGLRDQPEPSRTNAENALINITQFIKTNEGTILSTPITGRLTNSTATGNAVTWRENALTVSANAIRQTAFGDGGRGAYQAERNALVAGATQWSPMLDQSGDVRHRMFRAGSSSQYLVFSYNYAPTARTNVTFTFDTAISSITVVDEARTIAPSGATWTDNFGGSSSLTLGSARNAHIYVVTTTGAPPYFMSSEPGCDGSDPNVVLCDDMQQGDALNLPPSGPGPGSGRWASENADVAISNGGMNTRTKGWAMRIRDGYPHSYCAPGAGVAGLNCVYQSIQQAGGNSGGSALADHALAPGVSDGHGTSYSDLYFRFYFKFLPGHIFCPGIPGDPNNPPGTCAQKFVTLNPCCANDGGIVFGGIGHDLRSMDIAPQWDCTFDSYLNPQMANPHPCYLDQNQGNTINYGASLGNWKYIEYHVRLNTPGVRDGLYEEWGDDCGTSGVCTGTPTLRKRYTNVGWRAAGENRTMGVHDWDIWGNGSDGGTIHLGALRVGKTFSGFVGGTPAPNPPTALKICRGTNCTPS